MINPPLEHQLAPKPIQTITFLSGNKICYLELVEKVKNQSIELTHAQREELLALPPDSKRNIIKQIFLEDIPDNALNCNDVAYDYSFTISIKTQKYSFTCEGRNWHLALFYILFNPHIKEIKVEHLHALNMDGNFDISERG